MEIRESKARTSLIEAINKGYKITKEGDVISPSGNKRVLTIKKNFKGGEYYRFGIRVEGNKHANINVHQFQGYMKYGDKIFEVGKLIRHLNSDSLDNSWDNIKVGTPSENMMDQPEEVRKAKAFYAASFIKEYDHDEVYKFFIANGRSYKKTMAEFGIKSKSTLNAIVRKLDPVHGNTHNKNRSHRKNK